MRAQEGAFRRVLRCTFPVFWGYLAAGFAFGLLLQGMHYQVLHSFGMSVLMFAGSAQLLLLEFLHTHESVANVFLAILILNLRHFAYGLALYQRYKKIPWSRRWYLIFGLTDETFALISAQKEAGNPKDERFFLLWVTLINQSYWVLASVLGTWVGSHVAFDLAPLAFVLPALFVVLLVEYILSHKNYKLPALGGICAFGALYLAPTYMLPLGLLLIFASIMLMLERGEKIT